MLYIFRCTSDTSPTPYCLLPTPAARAAIMAIMRRLADAFIMYVYNRQFFRRFPLKSPSKYTWYYAQVCKYDAIDMPIFMSLVVIYALRFRGCIDFNFATAGEPFVFVRNTKRHRILYCVTPRPRPNASLRSETLYRIRACTSIVYYEDALCCMPPTKGVGAWSYNSVYVSP